MPPVALTVAGSDSGGGAGIQADLATFRALGVFGTCAITAVTAQNTLGVSLVHPLPPDVVRAQMRAVFTDLLPAAVKVGMLATVATVEAVAAELTALSSPHLVVDPVLVATSGDALADEESCQALVRHLVPLAALITPNLPEAAALTGERVATLDDAHRAARALLAQGARAALVTGGHLSDAACDVLATPAGTWELDAPRVPGPAVHGTGCTLSAAIAARLALGDTLLDAVHAAKRHVTSALHAAFAPGAGAPVAGWPARDVDAFIRIRSC